MGKTAAARTKEVCTLRSFEGANLRVTHLRAAKGRLVKNKRFFKLRWSRESRNVLVRLDELGREILLRTRSGDTSE